MVANLSAHKRGWDARWEEFSQHAEAGKRAHDECLRLIDADTDAFNAIMAAFKLPRGNAEEEAARAAAIEAATCQAIEVPLRTMEVALESMEVIRAMAELGNPASASDAGVGALCARSAVLGGELNVRINSKDLTDDSRRADYLARAAQVKTQALALETEILSLVESRL